MALRTYTKLIQDIQGSSVSNIQLQNGGILISINLSHVSKSYQNVGTVNELAIQSDIHAVLLNDIDFTPIIGQDNATPTNAIVLANGQRWSWECHSASFLRSNYLVNKLRLNSTFSTQPDGFIKNNLLIAASWDPNNQIAHNLLVEVEILSFD